MQGSCWGVTITDLTEFWWSKSDSEFPREVNFKDPEIPGNNLPRFHISMEKNKQGSGTCKQIMISFIFTINNVYVSEWLQMVHYTPK